MTACDDQARARVKPDAYRNAKKKVPTDQKMGKGKVGHRSAFHA